MAKSDIPNLKIDFEKLIDKGENPKGFTSQTPNGTAHWKGVGWNRTLAYTMPEIESAPTWRSGRSNRTGE